MLSLAYPPPSISTYDRKDAQVLPGGAAMSVKTWACSRQNLTEKVANDMWVEGGGETLPVTP